MAGEQPPRTGEVIPFTASAPKRREPQLSDAELAEYRAFLPLLRELSEQWPHLRHEHRVVASRCPLAQKLIEAEGFAHG